MVRKIEDVVNEDQKLRIQLVEVPYENIGLVVRLIVNNEFYADLKPMHVGKLEQE